MDHTPQPETTEKEGSGAEGKDAATPAKKAGLGWKFYVLVGLVQFFGGFLLSSYFLPEPSQEREPQTNQNSNSSLIPEVPQTDAADVAADLKRANAYAREGRLDLALALYQTLEGGSARSELLQYRQGLCFEGLGRWRQALTTFRYVVGHADRPSAAKARVSQGRVLIRLGQFAEAQNLLYPFLLEANEVSPELQADARYLLAVALSFEILPRTAPGSLDDKVVRPSLGLCKSQDFSEGNANAPGPPAVDAKLPKIVTIEKGGVRAEQKLLTASVKSSPVKDVLEDLAAAGGMSVEWSHLALEQVANRSTRLVVSNWPVIDVMQTVAGPLKFLCLVKGQVVCISTEKEIDNKTVAMHHAAVAQTALKTAVLMVPDHPLAAAALLELGNAAEAAGQWPDALAWYERLTREWPRSPLRIEAWFNSGVIYRHQGKFPQANKALYHVVDHSPGHELTPFALLRIGQAYLHDGEVMKSLPLLRRAVASGPGSKAHAAAVITLAAAYLAQDNWQAANALLVENGDCVGEKPYRQVAAFLDAYALFRGARARRETRREGAKLLSSMLVIRSDKTLGLVGQYLLGKAFGDLEVWEEVLRVYDTKDVPSNPLTREMAFRKVEAQTKLKTQNQVAPLLLDLAKGNDKWASQARYQLAFIALQEGRAQECLRTCFQLLNDQYSDRQILLHLMGEAYDRLGQHENAAKCFAGTPPG